MLIEDCRLYGARIRSVLVDEGVVKMLSGDSSQSVSPETVRVSANGASLLPGLVDSHCHPFEAGWLKRNLDLKGTSSVTALRLKVSARVRKAPPREWVTGMGWDQEAFPGRKMPTRSDLDDISPHNPVVLKRVCGHIALLNGRAIEALTLEDRQGVDFERGPDGSLTGIVKEGSLTEIYSALPRTAEQCAADLLSVEVDALRAGLTRLHCIVSTEGYREELGALAALHESGSLSLSYRAYIPPEAIGYVEERGLRKRLGDQSARINGVKLYADGSLGARTAALREPYADDLSNSGLLRYSDEELSDLVERADAAGYQATVHAIGDRAIEQAIYAISRVSGTGNPRRHRIEHASLLTPDLRSKMAKHGIRATVQPCFITSDTWASERLGEERAADLYPLKSMLAGGIVSSGSSDSPVETMSPVIGIWAAMTRGGSTVSEALSFQEALRLYTANGESNGLDDEDPPHVGSPANFTLLDSDIEGMHPALFRKVGVSAVMIRGALPYSALGSVA